MCQMVEVPASENALLDLLISNDTELITDVEVKDTLGNIDYRVITFAVNYRTGRHRKHKSTEFKTSQLY